MKTPLLHISFFALFAGVPACAAQEARPLSEVPRRDEYLSQMALIIAQSVRRTDTSHPIFHGCFDWHSAVHGHWALCRISHSTGDRRWSEHVASVLGAGAIAREREFLLQNPRFEMPYGRAWFLLLATEFELCAADSNWIDANRLRPVADDAAQSLLAHYERRAPDPTSPDYSNASWALVQLHAYCKHTQNAEFAHRTARLIQSSMLSPVTAPSFRDDATRGEFFSRFGNWAYLVIKTQDAQAIAAFCGKYPLTEGALGPVAVLPNAHHLGMNWSRAWALRALSRVEADQVTRQRLDRAYLAHVEAGMLAHAVHAGDYGTYDHWVPQFAVYALTE